MKVKLRRVISEVDVRAGLVDLPLLSVSIHRGVVLRSELTDDLPRADDLANYKVCRKGDLVVNRMRAFQGAAGVTSRDGLVSPDYLVLRSNDLDARFLGHLLRSDWMIGEMASRIRGIGSVELGTVRTPRINAADLLDIPVDIPVRPQQQRIADFLDNQVARINSIILVRRRQAESVEAVKLDSTLHALRGADSLGPLRPSGIPWLGDVPDGWPVTTVHSAFDVVLGKMLDEKKLTGAHPVPYLRNTNVQWDRIETDDLKVMDIHPSELERFTVQPGDLLICEGGQPGRSAVWRGTISPLGFQKALHRARPRGGNDVRWLQVFLRVAVALSVFSNEFGQATIGHLTGEQLRSARLPMPPTHVQRELGDRLEARLTDLDAVIQRIGRSVALLEELKRSLITSAVIGDFDVAAADGAGVLA